MPIKNTSSTTTTQYEVPAILALYRRTGIPRHVDAPKRSYLQEVLH